jgi:hypothetical protein
MSEIDVVDEAIIDADPATVAKAIRDESMGKTHWWLPYWEAKPRGNIPPDQVGGMIDITVRRRATVRFTAKTVEVTENLLRVEYVEGAYRGEGTWTFEPVDGKTRLRFRWRVQPTGWLRWLLLLAPPSEKSGRSHHEVMQAGFEGLNQYVKQLKGQTV